MPRPTPEQIAALEAKHRRVIVVHASLEENDEPVWSVVLRKPTRPEYKMVRAELLDEARKPDATERLFRKICVLPDGAGIDALLDEWPAVPEACSEFMLAMLGAAGKADAK